ncbi:MAG: PAS domain S-box protein [bacterium]|nr:PAS domain S-box protein [bacterium]
MNDGIKKDSDWYRRILENLPVLICRFLPGDGIITFVNNSYCQCFNKTFHELVGHSFLELIPEEEHEAIRIHLASFSVENSSKSYEHPVHTPDGVRWQRWTDLALFDDAGNVIEFQSIGEDITDKKNLEKKILEISEQERKSISQELHDEVGQILATISFRVEAVNRNIRGNTSRAVSELEIIEELVESAIIKTRDIAKGLTPVNLESDGLELALEKIANEVEALHSISCEIIKKGDITFQDNTEATHLYYIANESVRNAIKHGKPENIIITVEKNNDGFILSIKDDGEKKNKFNNANKGIGIRIMEHRAEMLGASFGITNHARGMEIVVRKRSGA